MKFTVNTEDFKKALEKVFKVVGVKTIETLENVRIKKTGYECHLLATNMEQFVDMVVESETNGDVDFQFSDTKALLKAMKFFTGYQIEFECGEHEVTLSCGGKKAKQRILDGELPEFPLVDGDIHNEFKYSNKKLKERFTAVRYAASTDENRKILTGICFRDCDMVAIDGFRLAINKDDDLNIAISFVAPLAALKNINEIMKENINIKTNGKYMQVTDDSTTFVTRLFDGEYMAYSHLVSNNQDKFVEVDIKDFENGLKYLKTFKDSKDKSGVHWYANKLGIKNMSGYFESEVKINGDMNMEVSFNGDYMLEALRQFDKKAVIALSTNVSPMIITSEDDKNNIALVLPVGLTEKLFEIAA